MRGKCQHPVVFARVWTHGVWITLLGDSQDADARRCDNCHAWLPLGPSRDDGEFAEAVACEVRAAELARPETIWTTAAIGGGYVAAEWVPGEHFSDHIEGIEEHAGYLAWLIEKHDTTHTEQREASDE